MGKRRLVAITSTILLGAAFLASLPADAAGGKGKKKANEEQTEEPAAVEQAITFEPDGLAFGANGDRVKVVYGEVLEKDYLPKFQKAEPGVEMRRLRDELERKKAAFARSYIELDKPPSNLDGLELSGEFTYGNKEAVLRITRLGKTRTLFFIRDQLWKIIDVYPLGESSRWGKDFKSAVAKLEQVVGIPGRALPQNDDEGRAHDEVDWADAKVHLRAIDWGDRLAVAYVDKATEGRLGQLRTAKSEKKEELDPRTKDALR